MNIFASLSSFTAAYEQSDFFGKIIILSLFAMSVVCWIVLLYKVWVLKKVRLISAAFRKAIEQHKSSLLNTDLDMLPKLKQGMLPHPFAVIFDMVQEKAVEVLNKNRYFLSRGGRPQEAVYLTGVDFDFLRSCIETAISTQYKELEKHLFILSTIVTLAPFMGLLGTVWGILVTFSGLHAGASVSSNSAILGGISTALATTVLGLIIAIPALVSYNYLRNGVKDFAADMGDFSSTLLSTLEVQYRRCEIDS